MGILTLLHSLFLFSDDQKKTVQQECVNLKASVASLKEALDNLEKKVTQVEVSSLIN